MFDNAEAYLRARGLVPDGWGIFRGEVKDDELGLFEFEGALVPEGGFGKKRPRSVKLQRMLTFTISGKELDEFAATEEARTGICRDCKNTGLVICGWGIDTGNRYKPCARCAAKKQEQEA